MKYQKKEVAKYGLIVLISLTTGVLGAVIHSLWKGERGTVHIHAVEGKGKPFMVSEKAYQSLPAMSDAAEAAVLAVAHITTATKYDPPLTLREYFYGLPHTPRYRKGVGSGVLISQNGYIVTNHHVVNNSDILRVRLHDGREFSGELVGSDPNSEIAIIKIEAESLPFLNFGNSESLRLGEWVIAIGNPFGLTSTVTAGIISAKSRSLSIIEGGLPLESFIQTDAAVNPGNSGGALVDLEGNLVGINTAIYSETGNYAGYAFAVPATIVKKVAYDIMTYGEVQRAFLGISYQGAMTEEEAKEAGLDKITGILIREVVNESGAAEAGLKAGDILLRIDGNEVSSPGRLQELIGTKHPGDKVEVIYLRSGKEKSATVTLKNQWGKTKVEKTASNSFLGASFERLSPAIQQRFNLSAGVQVKKVSNGKLKEAGVKDGFIILQVNKYKVHSFQELKNRVQATRGVVLLEGIYPNGMAKYFHFKVK